MSNDQNQSCCAIVDDGCGLSVTEKRQRSLDIFAAMTAFAGREVVLEIIVGRSNFAQSFSCFVCQWRAAEVCVNDDSSSVDDRLKPAGAEFLELAADKIDNRSEFGNLAFRANPRKFLPDDSDDDRSRKIDLS